MWYGDQEQQIPNILSSDNCPESEIVAAIFCYGVPRPSSKFDCKIDMKKKLRKEEDTQEVLML